MFKVDEKIFNKCIASFDKQVQKFNKLVNDGFKDVSNKCINKLNEGISDAYLDYYFYQDNDSSLDQYKSDIDTREIENKNTYVVEINIGSNSLIMTKNGSIINAFYFLCYGYGYVGTINESIGKLYWEYDINNHGSEGWFYRSIDGQIKHSSGIVGYDFILTTKKFFDLNATKIIKNKIDEVSK